jgi:hypothetical protein
LKHRILLYKPTKQNRGGPFRNSRISRNRAFSRLDGTPLESGLPKQLVKAAEWVDLIDEDDEDIRLFDYGESFLQGKEPERLNQPGTLRVPETIFTHSFDYRVDLWRIGCMVSEVSTHLFSTVPVPQSGLTVWSTNSRSIPSYSQHTRFGISVKMK